MLKIALIVPVYNVESYLRRCVDSILSQTYRFFELILVDDGSTDAGGGICDKYAVQDSRIHVIHQLNGGLSAARNSGLDWMLRHSDAEYVTFVDSDDWVEPSYLSTLLDGVSKYRVDIACAGYASVCGSVRYVRRRDCGWECLSPEKYWTRGEYSSPVSAWGKLYHCRLFDAVRYPSGKINEDVYTTHKLLFQVDSIAVRETPVYNYFKRHDSIMHSSWSFRRLDCVQGLEEELMFFSKNGYHDAYMHTLGRILVVMMDAIPHLHQSNPQLEAKFLRRIAEISATYHLPFWENRDYYHIKFPHTYWFRWFFGMVSNAISRGDRSWLFQEAMPIIKMGLERLREKMCHVFCSFARR